MLIRIRDAVPTPGIRSTMPRASRAAKILAGLIRSAFRLRAGVSRLPATPLDIDVLANVCLPLTVDEVVQWSPPGEEVEMLADGVVLDSPADMAAAWPGVWSTPSAARCWLYRHTGSERSTVADPYKNSSSIGLCDSARRFRYQRVGRAQKWRTGAYDPAAVPDLRAWLESRLGLMAGFELEGAAQPATNVIRPGVRRPSPRQPPRSAPRPRPAARLRSPHFRAPRPSSDRAFCLAQLPPAEGTVLNWLCCWASNLLHIA